MKKAIFSAQYPAFFFSFRKNYKGYNETPTKGNTMSRNTRRYGFWNFVGDVLMTLITSGLWLIWIFVREHRRK